MKKKEEGSLLPLWRRTVYKVKWIVQKGSGRPDLRFGPASCLSLKLCRRRKFWKMKKWKKEAYFRCGGAHWTRLKKIVQEGSGQLDLRFRKYQSRRVPVQPVASSSLNQKNGSLKWMCYKRKLWKICMKWKKEGQDQKLLFKKVGNLHLMSGWYQSCKWSENRIFHAVEPGTTNLAEFSESSWNEKRKACFCCGPPPASRTQWGRFQRPRKSASAWCPPPFQTLLCSSHNHSYIFTPLF